MSSQLATNMRGLVSLDGNTSIISTQLRLLPPSPKVLILPPLSTVVQQPEGDVPFDARAFIRHVHEGLSTRLELARSFLQPSSSTQPRLVFMNGGSISALTTCIAVIREKVTNGNIQEAAELFNAIVKGGVAGLVSEGETVDGHESNNAQISKAVKGGIFLKAWDTRSSSTTSHISHIAPSVTDDADFIDRLIDSLQKPLPMIPVEGENVNITNSSEHTTASPIPPDVTRLKSRFWTDERVIPKTERVIKGASRGRKLGHVGKRGNHDYTSSESSTYTDAVTNQERTDFDGDNLSTQPERPASVPSSHGIAKQNEYSYSYVEGKLSRHVVKKARSVDCLRSKDVDPSCLDIGPRKLKLRTSSPFTFSPLLRSEISSITDSESSDLSESSSSLDSLPGTTYIKALETLHETSSPLNTISNDPPRAFTNRGTYTGDSDGSEKVSNPSPDAAYLKEPAPFEPVFDIVEDLIIHFKDGGSNEVLESVIQSYKNGNYPIADSNVPQVPTTPASPASLASTNSTSLSGASHTSADTDEDWPHGAAEIDPENIKARPLKEYSDVSSESPSDVSMDSPLDSPSVYPSDETSVAPSNSPSNRKPPWPKENSGNTVHSILKPRLQIPVTNPEAPQPELVTDAVQKIHELSDISTTNAVTLQDSFRGVLKIRYPPETTHYKQHIFALENDRFWKPVFRMDARHEGEDRTVDQIIAIGYEDGVEKALYKEVIEQFDKLGTSATGVRASKLDIRFLVIYAMQTFTSQPLSLQAGQNPFSQPSLLATLLIPHLETFLSSSCPTRLLILHYPVSHLSTVLALRDLLGPQLLKVTGIIDSTAISPPKPWKESPNSIASVDELVSTTASQSSSPTQECSIARTPRTSRKRIMPQPSFSKADFLLLSPATEDEISTFLTSVWESLTFPSSSFFFPDDVLSPSSTLRPVPSPSTASSYNAPLTPPPDRQIPVKRPQNHLSPTRAPKRVSFADSTTSTEISTENTRRRERQMEKDGEKLESDRKERLSEKAWESFIMGNGSDESLLELERIFMPHLHFMPRAARRVGDSRKALKWLGLD